MARNSYMGLMFIHLNSFCLFLEVRLQNNLMLMEITHTMNTWSPKLPHKGKSNLSRKLLSKLFAK